MNWLIFGALAVFIGVGIRRAWREAMGLDRGEAPEASVAPRQPQAPSPPPKALVKETEQCPQCGAFIAVGSVHHCPEARDTEKE